MEFVKLKPINRICPRCGNGNYMRIISGKNVGELNVKCINCNSYYNYDELLKGDNSKPPIDAIPVEYLMKYAQLPTEFAIAAWRKQDKDAQKKQTKRLDKPMSLDDALNLVNEVFPLGQKEQEAR